MTPANDNASNRWSYVEVSGGIVTASLVEDVAGVRALHGAIGQPRFYIEAVDRQGGRLVLDSASEYRAALGCAEKARSALGIACPVKDTVAGGSNG